MWGGWDAFFHQPVDLSSLALFRMLLGMIVLADAVSYWRHAARLLDPDGLVPFRIWKSGPDRAYFSILRWLPASPWAVRMVIVLYGAAGVLLGVGLVTRWSAGAALILGMSLHHRNRWALHSGDVVARMMLLLLIFSEAGHVWSLDAVLAPSEPTPGSPWAMRLMQVQLAFLYLISIRFKLAGHTWRQGTATHYASRLRAHRRFWLPPWLDSPAAHRLATYGTLAVETAGGVLIWFPVTRWLAIAGLAALHLTLAVLMRMHVFQWTMLASLVLFVPGETTASLVARFVSFG